MKLRAAASVGPTLAESTASVPPGAGVGELTASPVELTVEVTPDSVAAFAKRPHKTRYIWTARHHWREFISSKRHVAFNRAKKRYG